MAKQQQFIIVGIESKFFEGAQWAKDCYGAPWKSFPLTQAGVKQATAYAQHLDETETAETTTTIRYQFRVVALLTTSHDWLNAQERMLAGEQFGLWSPERKLVLRQDYEVVLLEGNINQRKLPAPRIDAVMTEWVGAALYNKIRRE